MFTWLLFDFALITFASLCTVKAVTTLVGFTRRLDRIGTQMCDYSHPGVSCKDAHRI